METILNNLESVLCGPDGKCCISGSPADLAIVDEALATIRATLAQPVQPAAAQLQDARNSKRLKWLCADHAHVSDRVHVRSICEGIPVRSYSATTTSIDAAMAVQELAQTDAATAHAAGEPPTAQPVQPDAELECTRSHPHENMDALCKLRTVIARLENEKAAQPAPAARVPLTDFLMADEFTTTPFVDDVFAAFQQGVKFAEKHHGITTQEQIMIDTTKLRADALAATQIDHGTVGSWYVKQDFTANRMDRTDATHIANCDPATLIKLLDVVEAARILVNDAQAHPGVISVAQLAEAIQLLETK